MLVVDFAPKLGTAAAHEVMGQVVSFVPLSKDQRAGIVWQDGNTWEKIGGS